MRTSVQIHASRLFLLVFAAAGGGAALGCKSSRGGAEAAGDAAGPADAASPAGSGGSIGGADGGSIGGAAGGSIGGAAGGAIGGATGGALGGARGSDAATDPCATALLCDDFEGYAAGAAPTSPWRASINMGAVAIDTTQSHSGAKSVRFTTQARTDGVKTAFIELTGARVFPVTGNVFYGRMMFRLEAAPTTSVHWTFIQGAGVVPGLGYHALYRYGGQLPITQGTTFVGSQLMANYDTPDSYSGTGPSSDCWQHANKVVVPVGRWACAEWKLDGATNQMTFSLDGAPVPSLSMTGIGQGCVHQTTPYTWAAPTFDRLSLGWESYQSDGARTLYVDDVVISRTPIGCPP